MSQLNFHAQKLLISHLFQFSRQNCKIFRSLVTDWNMIRVQKLKYSVIWNRYAWIENCDAEKKTSSKTRFSSFSYFPLKLLKIATYIVYFCNNCFDLVSLSTVFDKHQIKVHFTNVAICDNIFTVYRKNFVLLFGQLCQSRISVVASNAVARNKWFRYIDTRWKENMNTIHFLALKFT